MFCNWCPCCKKNKISEMGNDDDIITIDIVEVNVGSLSSDKILNNKFGNFLVLKVWKKKVSKNVNNKNKKDLYNNKIYRQDSLGSKPPRDDRRICQQNQYLFDFWWFYKKFVILPTFFVFWGSFLGY
jgi:hypothetical protein